ncbi:2-(1,2-epoxy-1,2-dihydrophenyl)acetyl-CoA isomerase PaaG [Rhodocaloribacter litoris]|uniref:enoyl-CoA hydratase-related protein n=1 Tax=Rhodocaloribacter litoris TaxID=2558931 RepID=UPI00142363E3|nr:enoyl-CoA hydratase-related protein [Rhodocaloribacter litoris]QXD16256.1 2-(1,2-epoxy-1,2-dihydrophenyl)acetyl-CoA isomerase PaaG [Rhodocaloribacter litoris]GIV60749.1 MAG: 2-(1,2-epoxy-1,2-dihydrophenyl)acetyl-CoA isomerase [Rhodothermaceae bacterium]
MAYRFIRYEVDAGVAMLTLNRPDVLNSFHRPMAEETIDALQQAAADPTVRAVLLTGAGRAFCAGQDLQAVLPKEGEPPADLGEIVRTQYNPLVRLIRHTEKPFVAAVNGVAAGAGANLALACDFVLAAETAAFIQSFARIGLIPDSGGTFFLPRLVGLARATAMMMLADKVPASEAQAMGLIYKVCAPEALLAEATELARHLATMPTRGLGLIKRGLNQAFANDLDTHLDVEERLQREAGQTHDYHEGVAAFLEKRKPVFRGE